MKGCLGMISLLWLCGLNHVCREFKRRSDFSLCNELFLKILINVPRARHACFSFLLKAFIPVNENIYQISFRIKVFQDRNSFFVWISSNQTLYILQVIKYNTNICMIYAKTKIFYSLNKCLKKKVKKVLYMKQE